MAKKSASSKKKTSKPAAKKKPAARKKTAGTSAAQTSKEEALAKLNQQQNGNTKFQSVVLFTSAILFFLLAFVHGNAGWYLMHCIIRGIFGFSILLVPILLMAAAYFTERQSGMNLTKRLLLSLGLTVLVSSFFQIIFVGDIGKKGFFRCFKYLFVAGGVGTAPVYPQVKWMKEHGIEADVIVGAKTKDLLILEDEMRQVAGNLYVTTDDGSYERKGMVTSVIEDLVKNQGKHYDVCVAIGPMIMMKFVCLLTKELNIPTVVSMNPIMVDGTGMCGACRLMVGNEVKFACVDGPEFDGHLVDFDLAMKRQQMYKTEEGRALLRYQEGATHHGGCGQCGGDK